ncbi:MAG: tetratricopeptide repeat protein [Saprospiraceae bacterium]|nr:tetratricopeptide repeat protein [Saprospiraceae bacterium]
MAKKQPAQKAAARNIPERAPAPAWNLPDWMLKTRLNSLAFFALAVLLYANTLTHGFVQDDAIVITDNMFTTKGIEGIPGILSKDTFFGFFKVEGKETLVSGGRYRPMTLVLFAMLFQAVGSNPFMFHLLTVFLYAFTCVVLYRTLLLLFRDRPGAPQGPFIAWGATLLFTVHPIHTEVVANIKGCDEIVTLLGSLGALYFTLRLVDTGKMAYALWAAIAFLGACLSKENAATFTVVIPVAIWFFRVGAANSTGAGGAGGAGNPTAEAVGLWRVGVPVWVAFAVFFVVRGGILDWRFGGEPMELMNNPFLKIEGNRWVPFSFSEKLATIFYTLAVYLKLLFAPWPLTHDYYPRHIGIIGWSNPVALLSLLLHAALTWFVFSGLSRKDPVRFGILFYGLTMSIVSNLVFPIGTNMGERFAFMPSVGFAIAVAGATAWWCAPQRLNVIVGGWMAFALLFSALTLARNPVWASNEKLFFTDVHTSPNSAKVQNAVGSMLLEKAIREKTEDARKPLLEKSLQHLSKAVDIYPNYKDALISRGGCRFYLQLFDGAIADYRRAAQIAPDDPKARLGLTLSLRDGGKYYGQQKGDLETAEKLLQESWQLNDKDAETAHSLGVINGIRGRAGEALPWFEKAVVLAPDNKLYHENLAKSYYAVGNKPKGDEHLARSRQ